MSHGFARNFGDLVGLRLLLGAAESGVFAQWRLLHHPVTTCVQAYIRASYFTFLGEGYSSLRHCLYTADHLAVGTNAPSLARV